LILEIVLVLVIISLLSYFSLFSFSLEEVKLIFAANTLANNILLARHLALNDDKYDPTNKYWFKGWWQIRFSKNSSNDILYELFSDLKGTSTTFYDKRGITPTGYKNWYKGYYLIGGKFSTALCKDNNPNYPECVDTLKEFNLTFFGVRDIEFKNLKSQKLYKNRSVRIVFDYYGNMFKDEGLICKNDRGYYTGDCGDTDPLDPVAREMIKKRVEIKLISENYYIIVYISKLGEVKVSKIFKRE